MYKWHLQSALGRGRSATGNVSRVADGIASTLRAFSASARQCEDAPQPTRTQRSQTASQEISSLRQGVDARSLAAQAPGAAPKFAVRRVDHSPKQGFVSGGRGGFRGRGGPATRGFRGRGGPRGGARGGARGGLQGRGGRGGKPKPRRRGGARSQVDDDQDIPLTGEEKEYWHEKTYGLPQVYAAGSKTTEEALRRAGPALALNTDGLRGLQQTMQDRLNISAGRLGDQYVTQEELIRQYAAGRAVVFANEEEKQKVMGYWTTRRQLTSEASGLEYKPPVFNGLNDMEKTTILQSLTAGQYQALKDIGKGNVLAGIEVYTQKNETYTLADGAQLMDKIKALLPVSKPVAAAKSASPATKPAVKK